MFLKIQKKYFNKIIIVITLLLAFSAPELDKITFSQEDNLDEVYKDSFRKDIPRSMQNIPYEDQDYKKTFYSPYALVAIPKRVMADKDVLSPGYYLVKSFNENSVSYLIFKKNKVAVAVVPVISKEELPKKVKKIEYYLEEDQHGKVYILTIKYKKESFTSKLDILE